MTASSNDDFSSSSMAVPVIAGLAVGIGFIMILSSIPIGITQTTTLSPVLSLVTMDDGKSYNTHSGIYCGQSCDVLIFARVLPLPQIPVSNGSEIAFRATNYRGQQLGELHLIIQEIKQEDVAGGSSGGPNLIETNTQLAKTRSGNFKVENLPAGMYVINVIADWKGEQNPDFSHSLHRFTVNVTAGGNAYRHHPTSSPDEFKAGYSNGTVSVVVIPEGSDSPSSSAKNFEPSTIKVVIGTNNTVRWTNQDSVLALIAADNESDPGFYNATKNFVLIEPNKTFEYTFTKAGEFGYHGRPWQRGAVIVAFAAASSSSTPSSAHYLSYDGIAQVPPSHVLNGPYNGAYKDPGTVIINNQRYYLTTLNHTASEIQRGESVDFHSVTFSFPYGAFLTPGGSILIPDIKFQDGSEEVYGKSTTFAGGGGYMSGIGMPSSPHASKEPITVFTNHVHPQAALTLYNESVKLLVSVD